MGYRTGYFGYAALERALGAALYADAITQRGALRGRLKRLLTLGIPAPESGKGRRQYSLEEAHQLLLALLLEDAGLDPTLVAAAVKKLWARNMSQHARLAAQAEENPIWLEMRLQIVTGPWRTGDPQTALPFVRLVSRIDMRSLRKYREQRMTEAQARLNADEVVRAANSLREQEGWLVFRNFTEKAKKLETVLNEEG
jgi:hypothetical protein